MTDHVRDGERTRRAALTGGASLLRQLSRLVVLAVTTPVLIRGLGASEYGIWLVIQQAVAVAALADLRSSGTLKFSLAVRQDESDWSVLRRQVGSALQLWFRLLPLIGAVLVGLVLVLPPHIDHIRTPTAEIRWSLGIAFATTMLDRILSLPGQSLRGMNLDYRAAVVDSFTLNVGPTLAAVAAASDLGLVGVAGGVAVGMVVTNGARFLVARRTLPWFGVERASRADLRRFAGMSGWLVLGDLAGVLLMGTELLVVGLVLGAEAAAVYGTTQFVVRSVGPMLVELLGSGGPGVAQLVSRRDWVGVARVRVETFTVACACAVALSSGVLLANRHFVRLWVGADLYGGRALDATLVAGAGVLLVARTDAIVVDAALAFRDRSIRSIGVGAVTVVAMAAAGATWGLTGVAVAMLCGRVTLLALMPSLVARVTHQPAGNVVFQSARPLLVGAVVASLSGAVATIADLDGWFSVIAGGAAAAGVGLAAFLALGMDRATREGVVERITKLVVRARRPRPTPISEPDPGG